MIAAGRRPCALVVENNPSLRRLIRVSLEGEGIQVVEAASSTEALAILRFRAPDVDVVVMECWPEGSDMRLIHQIRGSAMLAHVPVIVLTGRVGESDRTAALEAGADIFIPKPFSPAELCRTIEHFAQHGRVKPPAPVQETRAEEYRGLGA